MKPQTKAKPTEKECMCGESLSQNAVHRKDGPCFQRHAPTAEWEYDIEAESVYEKGNSIPVCIVGKNNDANGIFIAEAGTVYHETGLTPRELKEVIKDQHEAMDILFAMLIEAKPGFMPSRSGKPWAAMVKGSDVIAAAERKGE